MNFRQLEIFFHVMTEKTITGAAKKLGVSQPSVTMTLRQAEDQLGFQLFEREAGRLIPTLEALSLFEEASRAHESLSAIHAMSEKLRAGRSGLVRVAATASLCLEVIPDTVARFAQKYPQYAVHVATENTEDILRGLDRRSGLHHIGFTFGTGVHEGLTSQRLGRLGYIVWCRRGGCITAPYGQKKIWFGFCLTSHSLPL